jgi:hypothetical protein
LPRGEPEGNGMALSRSGMPIRPYLRRPFGRCGAEPISPGRRHWKGSAPSICSNSCPARKWRSSPRTAQRPPLLQSGSLVRTRAGTWLSYAPTILSIMTIGQGNLCDIDGCGHTAANRSSDGDVSLQRLESVAALFSAHPKRIAAAILEAARTSNPRTDFFRLSASCAVSLR